MHLEMTLLVKLKVSQFLSYFEGDVKLKWFLYTGRYLEKPSRWSI